MSKLIIELNDEMTQLLTRVSDREGISRVEVLKRALVLFDYVRIETMDGARQRRLSITQGDKVLQNIELTSEA